MTQKRNITLYEYEINNIFILLMSANRSKLKHDVLIFTIKIILHRPYSLPVATLILDYFECSNCCRNIGVGRSFIPRYLRVYALQPLSAFGKILFDEIPVESCIIYLGVVYNDKYSNFTVMRLYSISV
uniref:Uncharacterized protein n=1 Tax=Glossina pallidipes TaxID=7398 RepID=A0A1A9ZF69_GLOPL